MAVVGLKQIGIDQFFVYKFVGEEKRGLGGWQNQAADRQRHQEIFLWQDSVLNKDRANLVSL